MNPPVAIPPVPGSSERLCVIAGNSASLLELPKQSDWADGYYFIGTDSILRPALDGRKYQPNLWMVNNCQLLQSDWQQFRDRRHVPVAMVDFVAKANLTLPGEAQLRRYLPGLDLPRIEFNFVFKQCCSDWLSRQENIRGIFPKTTEDEFIAPNGSVFYVAIQVAMVLGFRKVLLLGAETLPMPDYMPRVFFDDSDIGHAHYKPYAPIRGFQPRWKDLADELKSRGVSVLDGSPWRDSISESWFPFMSVNGGRILKDPKTWNDEDERNEELEISCRTVSGQAG